MDATDEIWSGLAKRLHRRCHFKVLMMTTLMTDQCPSFGSGKLIKSLNNTFTQGSVLFLNLCSSVMSNQMENKPFSIMKVFCMHTYTIYKIENTKIIKRYHIYDKHLCFLQYQIVINIHVYMETVGFLFKIMSANSSALYTLTRTPKREFLWLFEMCFCLKM